SRLSCLTKQAEMGLDLVRQSWDAGSRTVSSHSWHRESLASGARGIEAGTGRGPRLSGACPRGEVVVSRMFYPQPAVRSSSGTALAASGHLPIPPHSVRQPTTCGLPRARRQGGGAAVGRTGFAIYRLV